MAGKRSSSSKKEQKMRNMIRYVNNSSFKYYIKDILRNIDRRGGASISTAALDIIDSMIFDLFTELATEAKNLMSLANKRTLSAWDIQSAVMEKMRGEIAKHAISEGQKAVAFYADMTRQR
ncbi:histone H2B [Trichonephila clavata]|uniref:Histone H2B n=1 Tax=Trichonephila clavata TaxID=2740835 RepID=A0A8X6LEF9_TRICU|nr:histone H2B [Trichonephila clavata]